MSRLANKRCVITGAASGMGRAGALTFAREGGSVAVVDLNPDGAAELADTIRQAGGRASGYACDVTDEAAVAACIAEIATDLGGIDVCWANAGSGGEGTVVSTPLDRWKAVLDLNLTGMFLTARHVVPHMLAAGGGSLIFTSSSGVMSGTPNVASNMAAKGGVLGLTRQIATDFLKDRIRANAICPGPIMTPTLIAAFEERDEQTGESRGTTLSRARAGHPLGRFGEPEEVANVALFLASDESVWVNAQFINVSGTGF